MSLKSKVKISKPVKKHKTYDIISVGSGTVDAFVSTDSEFIKQKKNGHIDELIAYPLGSKILINNLRFEVGGGGTNTAVAFSRLGLKTGWLGKTGTCENSKNILEILHKEKIDFLGTIGNGTSGYSVILDSIGHDRTILAFKGQNDALEYSEIDEKKIITKWFYFCSMVGKSFTTQKKLAKFAEDHNIKIAFNPSSYQAKLGPIILKPILKRTELLILNREEAGYIVGDNLIPAMIYDLQKLGPTIVIITDGGNGAHCNDGKHYYYAKSRQVKILETTGAGDAFASTFLGAYIKKQDIHYALKLATTNAQSVIQHYGAKNILLKWNKLIKHEKEKPIQVSMEKIE